MDAGQLSCVGCAEGRYSGGSGATACAACSIGQYTEGEGTVRCTSCPAHTYGQDAEVKSSFGAECGLCPAGTHLDASKRLMGFGPGPSAAGTSHGCVDSCVLVCDVSGVPAEICAGFCETTCLGGNAGTALAREAASAARATAAARAPPAHAR